MSARIAAALALAAAALLAAFTWFTREYTHDDFFFAYVASMRGAGLRPARDFYLPNFSPIAEVFAPLFRRMPESFVPLIVGKALMLVVAFAIVAAAWRVTRLLGASVEWALAACAVLAWYPDFLLRSSDVRSDNIAAFFLLLTAAELLRDDTGPRLALRAGLSLGLALLCAYKVLFAFPIAAVVVVLRLRKWRPLIAFTIATALPQILYQSYRVAADGWPVVLRVWSELLTSVAEGPSVRLQVAARFVAVSPVAFIAIAAGVSGFARARDRRALVYAICVTAFLAIFAAANPFLFPYNLVILLPLFVPLIAGNERLIAPRFQSVTAAAAVVAAILFGLPAAAEVSSGSNRAQVQLVRWIWRATAPGERVFDWQGMHFGRRGIFHWWNYTGLLPRYESGWYSAAGELRADRVSLIVENYRIAWMTPRDRAFLVSHYVRTSPCTFAPGVLAAADDVRFEIFVPGDYAVVGSPVVDGRPAHGVIPLAAGIHELHGRGGGLVLTTPRRRSAGPPPCPRGDVLSGFR